jgi:hypothetical protein
MTNRSFVLFAFIFADAPEAVNVATLGTSSPFPCRCSSAKGNGWLINLAEEIPW